MSGFIQKAISSINDLAGTESLPLFKGIMDTMNDGAMIVDLTGRIIYVNDKFCTITGYEIQELIGENAAVLLLPKMLIPAMKVKVKERKRLRSDRYEIILKRKDGGKTWVRISASPIVDTDNKVVGSLGLHADITERKEHEALINKTLKEKALLLQETHHRVKNNMQIISSLMNLQAAEIKNKQSAKKAFLTCQKRIKAIAVLHEIIYTCDESGFIDFNKYCQKIVLKLRIALGVIEHNISITQKSTIGQMGIDNALTCGMLINELVTNCFEHAFDGKGGKITITTSNKGTNTVLTIKDNGKGFPETFDQSLGLQLVGAFVSQLDGKLDILNKKGTHFIITFPESPHLAAVS